MSRRPDGKSEIRNPKSDMSAGRLTLIIGGAGSGKSRYALDRAAACGDRVLFVATCVPEDAEMRAKVARHRAERPASWTTVERTRDLAVALAPGFAAAIVDCVTLLVSQILVAGGGETEVMAELERLAAPVGYPVFVVTNEVGQGIVPEHALARRFRDLAGRANRMLAARAKEVVLMAAGIPMTIKKEQENA